MSTTLHGPQRSLPSQQAQRQPVRVADQLVRCLERADVKLALGLPGGSISPLFDALMDSSIRTIITRHENGAVFAAAAYARQLERPAVVLLTSGPGVLNCTAALASASADGVPMVILAGEVARSQQGRMVLQDGSAHALDVRGSLRALAKRVIEVPEPSAAMPILQGALQLCMSGRPGPVVLLLPVDVLRAHVPEGQTFELTHPTPAPLNPLLLRSVAHTLQHSERVAIIAGSGCRWGDGPALLERLATRLGAPVVTTPKAKGVLPESHPAHRGVLGIGGHTSADAVFAQPVQTLLALGTSMGDLATHGWWSNLQPTSDFIQVDVDETRLGRTYPPSYALACTVEAFLRALLPRLNPQPPRAPSLPIQRHPDTTCEGLHPGRAIAAIQRLLPPTTVYAVDSGEHCFFALHYLHIDQPDGFLSMLGLGSMGSGISGALGLKLAQPGRTVACICGDGGMLMSLGEISTAVQHGLGVVWFVFNDGALGMVQHGHRSLYRRTPSFELGGADFAQAARALGARGFTARTVQDLLDLELNLQRGPVVVDVLIDGTVQMPKGSRLAVLGHQEEPK
ncbi:MAG: acetolactate synthase-1/2/3 large subunit [Kiritimatiellia bacterium]|jgi:acetolactate synthase-1/2/3 large subunit